MASSSAHTRTQLTSTTQLEDTIEKASVFGRPARDYITFQLLIDEIYEGPIFDPGERVESVSRCQHGTGQSNSAGETDLDIRTEENNGAPARHTSRLVRRQITMEQDSV